MVNPGEWAMLQEMRPMRYLYCIFAESVGFYTQETYQDNLTFGSALFGGWSRSRTLIRDNWREILKQTIFDISQEKRQPVCRCNNIPDRKGKNQRGASLILDKCQ